MDLQSLVMGVETYTQQHIPQYIEELRARFGERSNSGEYEAICDEQLAYRHKRSLPLSGENLGQRIDPKDLPRITRIVFVTDGACR